MLSDKRQRKPFSKVYILLGCVREITSVYADCKQNAIHKITIILLKNLEWHADESKNHHSPKCNELPANSSCLNATTAYTSLPIFFLIFLSSQADWIKIYILKVRVCRNSWSCIALHDVCDNPCYKKSANHLPLRRFDSWFDNYPTKKFYTSKNHLFVFSLK